MTMIFLLAMAMVTLPLAALAMVLTGGGAVFAGRAFKTLVILAAMAVLWATSIPGAMP